MFILWWWWASRNKWTGVSLTNSHHFTSFWSRTVVERADNLPQSFEHFKGEIASLSSKVPRCRAQSVTLPICYMVDVWLEFHHHIKSKWVKGSSAMLAAKWHAGVTLRVVNLSNPWCTDNESCKKKGSALDLKPGAEVTRTQNRGSSSPTKGLMSFIFYFWKKNASRDNSRYCGILYFFGLLIYLCFKTLWSELQIQYDFWRKKSKFETWKKSNM